MADIETKLELTGLANKLFMYTDSRDWQKLIDEVFTEYVDFDMSSAGAGPAKNLKALEICKMWKQGFHGIDSVHHQAGHYLITVNETSAEIYAYAVAMHFKKVATKGNTRSFVGSYNLQATNTEQGWRLTGFTYNLKFIDGNKELE
ncbi:MAG: nuclear transport factor 2 family protein [Ferruginibacter sp.]